MNILRNVLGYRDFKNLNTIIDFLKSNNLIEGNSIDKLKTMTLFNTTKQRTWLISDNQNVFCFLDDTSKDTIEFRWKEKKQLLKNRIRINSSYNDKAGIVDFGENHKKWYYSKRLYHNESELRRDLDELFS